MLHLPAQEEFGTSVIEAGTSVIQLIISKTCRLPRADLSRATVMHTAR